MTYAQEFLNLAVETGIIEYPMMGLVKFNALFQGNAHALQLAAYACREQMEDPRYLELANAGTLMSFDHPANPLLYAAALPFRGGDAKGFTTYSSYASYNKDRPNSDKVVVLGTVESDTRVTEAADLIQKAGLGQCVGAVFLYSPSDGPDSRRTRDQDVEFPILRVLTEEYVLPKL